VPKGGTFVLVYSNADLAPQPVILIDRLNNGLTTDAFVAPKNPVVIADFYIPYLCCNDCTPVAYIIPPAQDVKPTIALRNEVCSNEKMIAITVDPVDTNGQVAGQVFTNAIIKNADGSWSLEASNAIFQAQAKLTDTLTYNVNGISSMPESVTVYKFPDVGFKAEKKLITTGVAAEYKLVLTPNETDETSMQYNWTITSVTGAITNLSGRLQEFPFSNAGKLSITLQVVNGVCSNQSTQEIGSSVINMKSEYCSNDASVQIPVDSNTTVSSNEFANAVSKNPTDNLWWFDPSQVDLKNQISITGSLNFQSDETGIEPFEIIVYKNPNAEFKVNITPVPVGTIATLPGNIILTATENNVAYNWSINFSDKSDPASITPGTTAQKLEAFFKFSRQVKVILEVTNGPCVSKSKEQVIDLTKKASTAVNEVRAKATAAKAKITTKKTVKKPAKKKPK
ncbi:MAG: hypothetical protein ABI091_30870, partial [Ferruginibacter sp.]